MAGDHYIEVVTMAGFIVLLYLDVKFDDSLSWFTRCGVTRCVRLLAWWGASRLTGLCWHNRYWLSISNTKHLSLYFLNFHSIMYIFYIHLCLKFNTLSMSASAQLCPSLPISWKLLVSCCLLSAFWSVSYSYFQQPSFRFFSVG